MHVPRHKEREKVKVEERVKKKKKQAKKRQEKVRERKKGLKEESDGCVAAPNLKPELPVLLLGRVGLHGGEVLHPVEEAGPGALLLERVAVPGRVVLALQELSLSS